MKVVIIKYNAGNIKSVDFALRRIGIKAEITDDIETIQIITKKKTETP
jgi:imidazole glycerol-phosphate synthase subunit HisH